MEENKNIQKSMKELHLEFEKLGKSSKANQELDKWFTSLSFHKKLEVYHKLSGD